MKTHYPITEFAEPTGAPAAAKAYDELERRIANVHTHHPTTSAELDYSTDKAVPIVRLVLVGTPEHLLHYIVARPRGNGKSAADGGEKA